MKNLITTVIALTAIGVAVRANKQKNTKITDIKIIDINLSDLNSEPFQGQLKHRI